MPTHFSGRRERASGTCLGDSAFKTHRELTYEPLTAIKVLLKQTLVRFLVLLDISGAIASKPAASQASFQHSALRPFTLKHT